MFTKSLRRTIAIMMSMAAVGFGSAPSAFADEGARLSKGDQATLIRIFGHEPSKEEKAAYIDSFGRVPTAGEIAAYVASQDAETATLGDGPTIMPMAAFSDFFTSGSWINRSGEWSLSLMPRSPGIGNQGLDRTWETVYNRFNTSSHWVPYKPQGANESMRKQYACHYWYGMIKTPWNLEPHKRPGDVSSITCN